MATIKCPKCGSTKVQLSNERSKHGVLWLILFGWLYVIWWCLKLIAALMVLMFFDWWYALLKHNDKKGYVWLSKRIMENKTRIYYCHKCSNNFRV